jgi:hypothetical protein
VRIIGRLEDFGSGARFSRASAASAPRRGSTGTCGGGASCAA